MSHLLFLLLLQFYFLQCSPTPLENIIPGFNASRVDLKKENQTMFEDIINGITAKLMQALPDLDEEETVAPEEEIPGSIPKFFDSRNKWPQCRHIINYVRNQGKCGSSWAIHAASVMSDRLCIGSDGTIQVVISAEDILSCCSEQCLLKTEDACQGGLAWRAFEYGFKMGAVTERCKPDATKDYVERISCQRECTNKSYQHSYASDKFYLKKWYRVKPLKSVEAIQREILTNGPVQAWMNVHEDFAQNYRTGIYRDSKGGLLFNHFVKIIGWGLEKGIEYWLCTNSWGKKWGLDGLFKIIKGKNHLNCESYVYGGVTYDNPRSAILKPAEEELSPARTTGSGSGCLLVTNGIYLFIVLYYFI